MKSFSEFNLERLKWVMAGPHRFELKAEKDVVAFLEWPQIVGTHALGRTADATWEMQRLSLFGPYIRIRTRETGREVAHFGKTSLAEPGAVKFHDGHAFVWRPLLTVDGMTFEQADSQPIVDFRPHVRQGKHEANVSVHTSSADLPLLLLLGWYLLELEYREDIHLPSEVSLLAD